jgi:hypothetical protein
MALFRTGKLAQSPYTLLLIPVIFFLLGHQYVSSLGYRDPSSRYFNPSIAYDRIYTKYRSDQANRFVDTYNEPSTAPFKRTSKEDPMFCVGMLTLARPSGDVYFRTSLASLLVGLSQEERNQLHVMPFVTHSNQSEHPAWGEPWLEKVTDKILEYGVNDHMSQELLDHIKELEEIRRKKGEPDREKHMTDYTYLIRSCLDYNPKYVLMLEDDTLAIDGWLHRTKAAIAEVERQSELAGEGQFFYLRLFYTERGFGWDMGKWHTYARNCGILVLLTNAMLFLTLKKSPAARQRALPVLLSVNVTLATAIFLYFTVGYNVTHPLPAGVTRMPKGGCCAQGMIYPATKIPMLADFYEKEQIGFVDTLAEKLADHQEEYGLDAGMRWAVAPSILQHVGGKSSKGDNWGSDKPGQMSEAEKLWNFAYELNDAERLAQEHADYQRKIKDGKDSGVGARDGEVRNYA